jgi:hypothetical protein
MSSLKSTLLEGTIDRNERYHQIDDFAHGSSMIARAIEETGQKQSDFTML